MPINDTSCLRTPKHKTLTCKVVMEGCFKCEANFVPLSPISFLERAAFVYQNSPSIIYGDVMYTWKETYERCVKLASALSIIGVNPVNIVSSSYMS